MNLFSKNFIILYLAVSVLGIFTFHWFFISNMMPADECFSVSCVFSSVKTLPPLTMNILLFVLFIALIAIILPLATVFSNKFKRIPGRNFFKWKIDGFLEKLILWLKILEKRDPEIALIAARFSDFKQ